MNGKNILWTSLLMCTIFMPRSAAGSDPVLAPCSLGRVVCTVASYPNKASLIQPCINHERAAIRCLSPEASVHHDFLPHGISNTPFSLERNSTSAWPAVGLTMLAPREGWAGMGRTIACVPAQQQL
jgi:hypothetical protein